MMVVIMVVVAAAVAVVVVLLLLVMIMCGVLDFLKSGSDLASHGTVKHQLSAPRYNYVVKKHNFLCFFVFSFSQNRKEA
jgi:hypothetical protein